MSPVRVLVVEDESIVAEDLGDRLRKMGTTVVGTVATGEQAVQAAENSRPDLVLMDIRLKGRLDGVEAADQIRKKFHIPVVYLTAHSDEATLERAKRTQPQGYLLKPFEENDLRVNIELALYKHQMEERLRESEQRFATTLASIGDAVIATNPQGSVTFMNPAAEKLTAWPCLDALGRSLDQVFYIVNEKSLLTPENPMARALREGKTIDLEANTLLINKNGQKIPIDDCAAPIRDEQGQVYGGVLVFRDITEKRRVAEFERKTEEKMHWLQRIEAVSRFAGGVAHEINNMLTVVLGCGELLLNQLSSDHTMRPVLETMLTMGDRTAAITRQLLAFSRKQILSPARTTINKVIQKLHPLLRRLVGESVDLVLDLDAKPATVCVDRTQWQQVLINLALNARDAMPGGGTLTFETRTVRLEERFAGKHAEVPPGEYVLLTVKDTGCGMDRSVLDHLFEPFFTTKEVGKGTGLGLATVYGIVEQSGGHIFVESAAGRGTTLSIYLPVDSEAASAPEPSVLHDPIPRGSETILVVEDEDGVRSWVRHALEHLGYKVLEADGAPQALQIVGTHAEPIHLLLCDVMMPRMTGPELAHLISGKRPDIKVLYMSGYTDDTSFPPELREEGMTLLKKPFTASALAYKVRKVLDRDGNQGSGDQVIRN